MINTFRKKWCKKSLHGNPPGNIPGKTHPFLNTCFYEQMLLFASRQRFLMVLTCSWVFWPKNDTERSWSHLKKQVLEQKRAVMVKNKGIVVKFVAGLYGHMHPNRMTQISIIILQQGAIWTQSIRNFTQKAKSRPVHTRPDRH